MKKIAVPLLFVVIASIISFLFFGNKKNTVRAEIVTLQPHATALSLALLRIDEARSTEEEKLMISRLPQILEASAPIRATIQKKVSDEDFIELFGRTSNETNTLVLYDRMVIKAKKILEDNPIPS